MTNRRDFVKAAGAAAGAALLPQLARAQAASRRNTLRFVPETNLTVLDPIFSPVTVTQNHGYHVYDTLYGVDGKFRPMPQMAVGNSVSKDGRTWDIKLRDGLKFHDGEPVRAQDCAASMLRWSKRDSFGQQLATIVEGWEAADDKTLRVRLNRAYPRFLEAIAKPSSNGPFIMPERLAKTDPFKAITDATGSGPYRFVANEYVSGSRVVYEKFAGYVPRSEKPELSSGGKVAHFQRIEWHIIPDKATATSALQTGEVDWLEYVDNDLLPLLAKDPNVKLPPRDEAGRTSYIRFNTLHAPFDKAAVRRVVLESLNQIDYMEALSGGDKTLYKECYSMFPCGFPLVKEPGRAVMKHGSDQNLERQKAALKSSGYKGEKVVILAAADIPFINTMAQITADTLKRLGMNVDLQVMDWGTMAGRRNNRETPDKGGWNIFPTAWPTVNVMDPAMNVLTRGVGGKGYVGWYESAEMEKLVLDYIYAPNDADQQRVMDAVQKLAFETVPSVPTGMFYQRAAMRKDLAGFLPGWAVFPWNIRRV